MNNKFINSPYNKTIYTAVVGTIFTFIFQYLSREGINIPVDIQVAGTGLAMAITTYFIPNKPSDNS